MIENVEPETIAAAVTFLAGIVESARRFRTTGKIPITELPWAAKRELFRWFRKSYFTVDKPDSPSFVVDMGVTELERVLAEQGFVPEWPLSYRYGGEVANLRYYFYEPSESLPHRQIHVRAFEHPDGLEIMAHEEPTPDHHPREHLESRDMSFESANENVRKRLEKYPVGYPAE